MSYKLTVRLSDYERMAVREMSSTGGHGAENDSDFIRLLIHREFNRRKGFAKPFPSEWQGVFRVASRKKQSGAGASVSAETPLGDSGVHTHPAPSLSPRGD
jgi:hypothetical protein